MWGYKGDEWRRRKRGEGQELEGGTEMDSGVGVEVRVDLKAEGSQF